MRQRWLVGLCVVVVLAIGGRAATMAQRVEKPVLQSQAKPEPKRWTTPAEPGSTPKDASPLSPIDPQPLPIALPAPVNPQAEVFGDDPMVAVDSFLRRNRKEAEESIKALSQEAETLRSRLQKVEAALARWQGVSAALEQDAPPSTRGPDSEPGILLEPIRPPGEVQVIPTVVEPPALPTGPEVPPAGLPSPPPPK